MFLLFGGFFEFSGSKPIKTILFQIYEIQGYQEAVLRFF